MKYYIKSHYGDWKEVSKEKADKFIKLLQANSTCKKSIIKERHYKEVER